MTEKELYNEYQKSDCKSFTDFLINKIGELEKENAELKEKLGDVQMQKAGEKSDLVWKLMTANEQKADQLTKAKEIIKKLYPFVRDKCYTTTLSENKERQSLITKAEQFLSEVEK